MLIPWDRYFHHDCSMVFQDNDAWVRRSIVLGGNLFYAHKTRYRAEYSALSTFMEPTICFLWISTLLLKGIS
jgi:hypothetical protein